mgnify:CR=1 FL=1
MNSVVIVDENICIVELIVNALEKYSDCIIPKTRFTTNMEANKINVFNDSFFLFFPFNKKHIELLAINIKNIFHAKFIVCSFIIFILNFLHS